jgi:hypothetical protein
MLSDLKKPQTPIFSRVSRKPVFIIALMFTLIVLGSYAAQYYTWSVSYTITPLTTSVVVVDIGTHSGATNVTTAYYGGSETNPAVNVNIPSGKTLDVYTFISQDVLNTLEASFYSIRLTIWWKESTEPPGEYNSGSIWLVYMGVQHPVFLEPKTGLYGVAPLIDGYIMPTISHTTGPQEWHFWFEVDGIWTGAVSTSTGATSFPIWVYAVEV